MLSRTKALFAITALLLLSSPAVAQLSCAPSFVSLDNKGTSITVEPTGVDDTENLQCALDEATRLAVPTVRLTAGEFFSGGLQALDFTGSFQGATRTSTTLRPLTEGVDCGNQQSLGQRLAWLKFIGGAAQLRNMSIDTTASAGLCESGLRVLYLVHFTGRADAPECAADVIQSGVDRVDFIDDYPLDYSYRQAVAATPESQPGGCYDRLLGGVKINRSTFTGSFEAIEIFMVSSAQVDINFNSFDVLGTALRFDNSNVSATILRNTFNVIETPDLFAPDSFFRGQALSVYFDVEPTVSETRISFENNTVNLGPYAGTNATAGLLVSNRPDAVSMNLSVRSNQFVISEAQQDIGTPNNRRSMELTGVSNASIAGNRFRGNGGGVFIFPSSGAGGTGNAITGNTFNVSSPTIPTWGVYFLGGAKGNTVGPNQNAPVWDNDGDNFLSPDGNDLLYQGPGN
jgi:hypothetical protein